MHPATLFATLCLIALPAAGADGYRSMVERDAGWPRGCGAAVSASGWDIRIVRQRVGDEVLARIDVLPPEGHKTLPVLARLEVEQFRPAILLVPQNGRLTLPGFEADDRQDWATLLRNFLFFGGRLVLGQVDGDVDIPFAGPAPREVTARYLDCTGDLAEPLRSGS